MNIEELIALGRKGGKTVTIVDALLEAVDDLERRVAETTRLLKLAESEILTLQFRAACSHRAWGRNAGYDVCLECGYQAPNNDGI